MKTVYLTFAAALFVSLYLGLPTPALESAVAPPAPAVTPAQFAAVPPVAMPTAPIAGPQVRPLIPRNNLSTAQVPNAVQTQELAALLNLTRLQSFTFANRLHFVAHRHRRTYYRCLPWTHIATSTARR